MCLTNSVDNSTKRILVNEEQVCKSAGQSCNITYLKLLILTVEIDTRAATSLIRNLLIRLNSYMIRATKNSIIKLNQDVSYQMTTLASIGKTSNDIITNLFTGYMACADK
jgi:hypothetical protein